MSETTNIEQKLLEIQKNLKAPKGQYNAFGNYNYRSCEDIIEAVKPLCHDQGCNLTISDEISLIGNRFYIKATATLSCDNASKSVNAYAREEENKKGMDGAQITGAASSYARKYALNGLFAIDDTKDSDATNKHDKGQPKQQSFTAPSNSNTYVLKSGKQKGKPIDQCDKEQLKNFYAWATSLPEIKGALVDDVNNIKQYLGL